MVVSALLSLSDPTIMPNHGFYRPIYVTAPAGSLVNPQSPAPAVGFPDVCNRIVDVIIAALAAGDAGTCHCRDERDDVQHVSGRSAPGLGRALRLVLDQLAGGVGRPSD